MTEPAPDLAAIRLQLAEDASDQEWDHGPSPLIPATLTNPRCKVERLGPSYRVRVRPLSALFVFRDVRTGGELAADVSVGIRGRHLFRTTSTLTLTGREKIAKVAAEISGEATIDAWKRAVFAAVEDVLAAEEQIGAGIDLRSAELNGPRGGTHVITPFWPSGSVVLVSPGEGGKSTFARALAVSLASGRTIIPGLPPVGDPRPVLYVAAEDPVAHWHSRSIEAICRGASMRRSDLAQPIELFDARGRPIHRMIRSLAERAAGYGAVVLDSQQALLSQLDEHVGIRDRDSLFWTAIDQLEMPVFIIAHPNRSDARNWAQADGRIAGSEVNRDRSRMAWRGTWRDEPAVHGTSYRRYTLENTKNSHGPTEAPITFAASWTFGYEDDPGILTFSTAEPVAVVERKLSPPLASALEHYRSGITTPTPLAQALGINVDTAKSRLRILRERGLIDGSDIGS